MSQSVKSHRDFSVRRSDAREQPFVRRMSDKILASFNHACEEDDLEVAALLLVEYERIVTRLPIRLGNDRRHEMEELVDAHARLWQLLRRDNAG